MCISNGRAFDASLAVKAVQYGFNARQELLEAGVVGIRTAGVPHFIDVGMKRAFDAWHPVGPRVFAGGYFLTTTAGHALAPGFAQAYDGPNGFVKAIREQIQHGVDQIKLVTTGGIMGGGHDVMSAVMFLREELEAALRIARQRGVPVAVHATFHEAVKWAVRAGKTPFAWHCRRV
jgi:imidazolonepropionase-like amidohydrolase